MTHKGVLIGCGFFAGYQLHAWAGIEGAEIVAVCDIDRDKAEAVASRHGVNRAYDHAENMLATERPDFVDIVTTSPSHLPLVELASAHAGLVICQKPIADSFTEAARMVEVAAERDVPLLIHENFRWQKPFREIDRLIKTGAIGVPHFVRIHFRHRHNQYAAQPYLTTIERFSIMDVGLHLFDLIRHLIGEVANLTCIAQTLNPIVAGEDAFTALLRHESGCASVIDCSFHARIDPDPFPQTLAWIEGERGTLELRSGFELILHSAGGRKTLNVAPDIPSWGEDRWRGVQDSVIAFQRHVLEVMNGKAAPQPSGRDNLRTLTLALAAYDSAEHHRTIDLATWASAE